MSRSFLERAAKAARTSRIIVAFDPVFNPYAKPREERARERKNVALGMETILQELAGIVAGAKIGVPAIFALGLDEIEELIKSAGGDLIFICDSKMADIGHVNRLVAEQVFDVGFDALIIHAAVGRRGAIDEVVKLADERGKGVLGLCAMSHPGASEHLNRHMDELLGIAASAGVDGFVLPATFPDLITRARRAHPSSLILSPGVGMQGAPFGSAVSAGADFEIIGRSITGDPDPARRAREIAEAMRGAG